MTSGVSQRAAATALGVPRTTLLRHLAEHGPAPVQSSATLAPPIEVAPIEAEDPAEYLRDVEFPVDSTPPALTPAEPARRGPGRPCACCYSDRRAEIDGAIARGASYRAIEGRSGVSRSSARHHATVCVPALLAEAADHAAARDASTVETVRTEAEALMSEAKALVEQARAAEDLRERAACLLAAKGVLELLARISGELGADVEIRVQASPSWTRVRSALLTALTPHPLALAAVISALQDADG